MSAIVLNFFALQAIPSIFYLFFNSPYMLARLV